MKTTPDFKQFFKAYLEAALFSSNIHVMDQNDGRNGEPFDRHFGTDDFDPEALEILEAHCLSFWSRMYYYMPHERGNQSAGQAGHDFWLTSNNHGAGFWDGGWPKYGEQFTKLSKCYPEINLCITDSGKVGIA